MDCTVREVAAAMERWAPASLCEPGDNVGLLAGFSFRPVGCVLIALDVDEAVLAHAKRIGAEMVVAHHPFLYRPVSALNDSVYAGRLAMKAIEAEVAVFAAHTNLDRAPGGVNDTLCAAVGLLHAEPAALGSIARLALLDEPLTLDAFAANAKNALGAPAVRVTGEGNRQVKSVYVISGAGRHGIRDAAKSGAECMLTGEIGYHDAQDALGAGLCVVEAGHYYSEAPVLGKIEKHLQSEFLRLKYTVRTEIYPIPTCPFRYLF